MPRKKKPALEVSANALRAKYGDVVTFQQIVDFEKEVGYVIGIPLKYYMDKVAKSVWKVTDESIARYTKGLPPPKPAKVAKPVKAPKSSTKEPKAPKVAAPKPPKQKPVKAPKAAKSQVVERIGGFAKNYHQLCDLRKDFEDQGAETIENKSYVFTNKYGSFNMVNGILYVNRGGLTEDGHLSFDMVPPKQHGEYLKALVEG